MSGLCHGPCQGNFFEKKFPWNFQKASNDKWIVCTRYNKKGVPSWAQTEDGKPSQSIIASGTHNISISQILEFVGIDGESIVKYFPDDMLNEAQNKGIIV